MDSKERKKERYLPQQEERKLIRAAQDGNLLARDRLVDAAMPFVRKIIDRPHHDIDINDIDDLQQESVPVLYDCIRRYDLTHPARARLYVFAERALQGATADFFRQKGALDYSDSPPDICSNTNVEKTVLSTQIEVIVRSILATMSITDQDLLMSRHAGDTKVTRAAMAKRYGCAPHVIEYAEKRARERFEKALYSVGKTVNPA